MRPRLHSVEIHCHLTTPLGHVVACLNKQPAAPAGPGAHPPKAPEELFLPLRPWPLIKGRDLVQVRSGVHPRVEVHGGDKDAVYGRKYGRRLAARFGVPTESNACRPALLGPCLLSYSRTCVPVTLAEAEDREGPLVSLVGVGVHGTGHVREVTQRHGVEVQRDCTAGLRGDGRCRGVIPDRRHQYFVKWAPLLTLSVRLSSVSHSYVP